MTSLICGIQKEVIQMNSQNRLTDLENELMVGGVRVGKGYLGSLKWTCAHCYI